ncbi:YusW family protein [Bacillus massiliigorillae]|uniref:YusW family protein n=1 Tax=Bacillus massiliigorillae TaxID=1243664 RepID=UPI0003A69D71|nr:YusW family protein [Bacillus massiliigorillae]
MKKLLALFMCAGLLVLGACGNDNADDKDTVKNPPENAPVENGNDNDTVNNPGSTTDNKQNTATNTESIPFISFDLDVDYDNFKSFEVEYDNETDGLEVKIEDELNNRTLRGDEALAELRSRFESFKFDKNTAPDEVINEVIKSFDLKEDYKKFDLEIKFADGTEKEYLK